jgi:guanine deaminase
MSHVAYLSDQDKDLIKMQGSAIAHYPLSNASFDGGCLPCRKIMEQGNKIGLRTEIIGGYSPLTFNSCPGKVITSLSVQQQSLIEARSLLDCLETFSWAILGGAEVLGLQDRIGSLKVSLQFDAFVLTVTGRTPAIYSQDTPTGVSHKL